MPANTKDEIINYLKVHRKARVEDLIQEFGVSRQLVHRHLKKFIDEDIVIKFGNPPLVFYELTVKEVAKVIPEISIDVKDFINTNYLWISGSGEVFYGFDGFVKWVDSLKMMPLLKSLSHEYMQTKDECEKYRNSIGLIDATEKFKNTFDELFLDKVFYLDFYSLPKFGKTRLGQLVLHSKQGQQLKLIKKIASEVNEKLPSIFNKYKIDAVSIIPPTIPRQLQFLKELERNLDIKIMPKLNLVKAYRGEIPVAQKTLSRLSDRIENARKSIYIKDGTAKFNNILLIDDAVGSGSSMNETARKMKLEGAAKNVYGLAIVGSYKGFDVINEV